MPSHVDILEQTDSLHKPLAASVALHISVTVALVLTTIVGRRHVVPWGSPNPGGGTVGLNIVKGIPLPSRSGRINPVANDTESQAPSPPVKTREQKRAKAPEPDAIPLRGKTKKSSQTASSAYDRWRAQQKDLPNQVYSSSGQAVVSPMIGQTGSGGVGVGPGGPFGNRYGWYVDLLRQKVAEKWHLGDVDARLRTAPPVIVTFVIQRDGSVRDVRVAQRSGNYALDTSAQRAILEASPFRPLPPDFNGSEARIEFWFQLRR
jgi:protein TonB